ncbi:MAG: hypothetical protein ACR2LT_08730 [Pyrinomonadaceae bacterium]
MFFVLFIVALFGGILLFGWWMMRWQYSTADSLLENWTRQNKYKLIEKKDANFGDGPIGRRGSKRYVKYRIKIQDEKGNIKSGIIYLGDENIGTLSDEIKVDWDD